MPSGMLFVDGREIAGGCGWSACHHALENPGRAQAKAILASKSNDRPPSNPK